MDVDLRKLRYFLAVAETSNFRHAAELLHISQPALTRQIRSFEAEISAQLFVRSSGGTRLTAAGRELREQADALLTASEAVLQRVGRATLPGSRLIVGFAAGVMIHPLINEFMQLNPDCEVDLRATLPVNQSRFLVNGSIDVCLGRLPISGSGITVAPVYTEPRILAVGRLHRLATVTSVGVAQLTGERIIQPPEQFPAWWPAAFADEETSQTTARWGEARTVEDRLENVAAGNGLVILPSAAARIYPHPGVVYKRLNGVPPATIALAHQTSRESALLRKFIDLAQLRLGNRAASGLINGKRADEYVA
ncbi:LysR family transcriptional regulator [Subtercola lobariae]|uniref:LysR family transcriptional regulator n=1 Tax=Subtercola lobariae TaxID=1588641 RepID=A0A917EYP7_9MICO|nr:LysR family transcriptional regulator [Subtercola lobariae]GGF32849.1 LysR family transcriptional regulator [Subtercola lobariae]